MELRQLRYFLAVVEEAHFTRAADQLYVSQPALSQQIRLLEQELGAVLIDRAGKKVRPTAAGQTLADYARRALRELEDARVALAELEGLQRGTLEIGVVQTVNAYFVPPLVGEFARLYPHITLQLEEGSADDIEKGILAGSLQMGIGFVPPTAPDIESEPLFTEELIFIARATHPLAQAASLPFAEMAEIPLVLLSSAFCTRRLIETSAHTAGVTLNPMIEMNTIGSILGAIRHLDVGTILPALALATAPSSGLVGIPLEKPTPRRTVGLLLRRGGYQDAATRTFMELCRSFIQALPESVVPIPNDHRLSA